MAVRKVVIIGYGVVGSAMGKLMARAHEVSYYDPPKGYKDDDALAAADFAIICVPTPESKCGAADTSIVEQAARLCKRVPLVCIKSTVPPGTTDRLNRWHATDKFNFSPEYIGELSNYVDPSHYLDPRDASSHPFCIVGGPRASVVLEYFQRCMAVTARYIPCKAIEAELSKYIENTYLAMKVTFCTEWERIARAHGVDYKVVRHLWMQDPRIDPSHTLVFADEPGFGGKCLPKDLAAIIASSEAHGFWPRMLASVREINDRVRNESK